MSNELKVTPIVIPEPQENRKLSFYSLLKKFKAQLAGVAVTFDDEEMAGDNYKLIQDFYDVYHKLPGNPTYAKRMIAHKGCEEKQYIIDLLAPFQEGEEYPAQFIKDHIAKVYLDYGINSFGKKPNKAAKPTDLCTFGVEVRKKKKSIIFYEITKMPDLD